MKKTMFFTALITFAGLLVYGFPKCSAPAGDNQIILENGSYFNGKAFVPFKEMILKDGRIFSIQSKESKAMGRRIAVNGKYVIPGLIDAHVHVAGSPAYPYVLADPRQNANSALNCGVTTMIDLFYPEDKVKDFKAETGKSPELYSSMIMSGPILTAPGGHGTEYGVPTRTITSVQEAKKATKEVIDGGVDVIKLVYEAADPGYIPSITKEELKAIVEVAHSRNKKVFAHIDRASQAMDCVDAGVDILAHMPADELTDAQLRKIKAAGTIVIPTLVVTQSFNEGHDAAYMSDSLLWRTANPAYLDNFERKALPKVPMPEENLHKYYPAFQWRENLSNCIKMKIPILAGTDAGNYAVFYGYSLHEEIRIYTQQGMSNAEALNSASENIGLVFPGIKTGKIAAGYDADLVVLEADPLKDIANTKSINMVFHKGQQAKLIPAEHVVAKEPEAHPFDPAVLDVSEPGKLSAWFSTYNDATVGGSSTIDAKVVKDPSGGYCLRLDGKVVKKGYMGFAGAGFGLAADHEAADISDYKGITFDVKGNGESYVVSLVSTLVKDYNFHSAPFGTSGEWKTVSIPFTDAKQSPYYGKQIPLDLTTIKSISYTAGGKDMAIDLSIKNIHLTK